ncbi:hypothetical protein K1719_022926 [Acacia pycnantha]|nr:hypothetical protein K1719_022926 [Acacia pycnantha]
MEKLGCFGVYFFQSDERKRGLPKEKSKKPPNGNANSQITIRSDLFRYLLPPPSLFCQILTQLHSYALIASTESKDLN